MRPIALSLFVFFAFAVNANAQLLIELITEGWVDASWVNEQRVTYDYNSSLNTDLEHVYNWDDSTSLWEENIRVDYTYDGSALLVEKLSYYLLDSGQTYNLYWGHYTYNSDDLVDTFLSQRWISTEWRSDQRYEHAYDIDGNITERKRAVWDMLQSSWRYIDRLLYTYNSEGRVTELLKQSWNVVGSSWHDSKRTVYTYDVDGLLVQELNENYQNQVWVPYSRILHTNNGNGNQVKSETQQWNSQTMQWVGLWEFNYEYNTDNTLHQRVTRIMVDSVWVNDHRETYYYDMHQQVEETGQEQLLIYPNPATDHITITMSGGGPSHTQIYDSQGRIVATQVGLGKTAVVDVRHLSSGTYFIRIEQGVNLFSGAFVKE